MMPFFGGVIESVALNEFSKILRFRLKSLVTPHIVKNVIV